MTDRSDEAECAAALPLDDGNQTVLNAMLTSAQGALAEKESRIRELEEESRAQARQIEILNEVLQAKLQQLITLKEDEAASAPRKNSAPSPFSSSRSHRGPEHMRKLQEAIDGPMPEGLGRSGSGSRGWRGGEGVGKREEKAVSEDEVRRMCALKNEECERLGRRLRALTDEMNARNEQVVQLMARLEEYARPEDGVRHELRTFRSQWDREVEGGEARRDAPSPPDRPAPTRPRAPAPLEEAPAPRPDEPGADAPEEAERGDGEAAEDAAAAAVRRFFELGERRKYDSRGRRIGPLDAACSKKTLLRELKESRVANGQLHAELRAARDKIAALEAYIAAGPAREAAAARHRHAQPQHPQHPQQQQQQQKSSAAAPAAAAEGGKAKAGPTAGAREAAPAGARRGLFGFMHAPRFGRPAAASPPPANVES
eukprot:tig00020780_g13788.t1